MSLVDALQGARYVHVDEDQAVVAVWYGGETVSIFACTENEIFEEIDTFDFADPVEADKIGEEIEDWLNQEEA